MWQLKIRMGANPSPSRGPLTNGFYPMRQHCTVFGHRSVRCLATVVLALIAVPGDRLVRAAVDPDTPICLTAGSGFAPLLTWSTGRVYIQPPTYQFHLQLVPYQNDGPGIDLIRTKASDDPEAFQVELPPRWYGLLPDLSYTWRARLSDTPTAVGPEDPSWGA